MATKTQTSAKRKANASTKRAQRSSSKKKRSSPARKRSHSANTRRRTRPSAAQAPEECSFWVNHGPVVRTIAGLAQAVEHMSDEQFAYHTQRAGNDFARWIDEVFGDHACAGRVRRARTRAGVARALAACSTAS